MTIWIGSPTENLSLVAVLSCLVQCMYELVVEVLHYHAKYDNLAAKNKFSSCIAFQLPFAEFTHLNTS